MDQKGFSFQVDFNCTNKGHLTFKSGNHVQMRLTLCGVLRKTAFQPSSAPSTDGTFTSAKDS